MNPYIEAIDGAVRIGVTLIFSPILRRWYNRWGATDAEIRQQLPADKDVPQPSMGYTRAITIHAPVSDVWCWLVQIGQGRGGLYSYDVLENIIGCQIHSVNDLRPDLQQLQAGDAVRLGPDGYPLFAVSEVVPNQVLVLRGADPKTGKIAAFSDTMPEASAPTSWVFYLQAIDTTTTRLLVRQRLYHAPKWALTLMWRIVEPLNFVMERKMLYGIKQRAEAHFRTAQKLAPAS